MNVSSALRATRQAMGKGDDDEQQPRAAGACRADDCPCRGTVELGGSGRTFCSWHAWAPPQEWGEVTRKLLDHMWLIDFIGEVMRVHSRGKLTDWIARSDAFFATDPHCQPTGEERDRFAFYLWRLREELSWRVGVRKDRPEPRVLVPMPKAKAARVFEAAKAGAEVPLEQMTAALHASGDLDEPDFDDIPWPEHPDEEHKARLAQDPRFAAWTASEPEASCARVLEAAS